MRFLLLLVLAGAAVLLAQLYLDGAAAAAVTAVSVTVPMAYLGWANFRASRAEAAIVDLEAAAGRLAVAVKNQWDGEEALRRVNDPYPLPVAWRAAADDLAEPWRELRDRARAWPGGPPGDPAFWPHRARGLVGKDAEIGEVFTKRVPTRRLVVLGERGAGKSVLLIRLLQDLIANRTDGDPVPVLFSLASWTEGKPLKPLKTWLAEQLRRTYPGLRSPAPAPVVSTVSGPGDLAQALLEDGRILPLLDGFDELPEALHADALDALNRALSARQPLVLVSQADPYRAALAKGETTVRLNGAAAIQLVPLAPDVAAAYLRRDAGGPPTAARWDAVIEHLGNATPVGQALRTPLGLFLARTIYNLRPHAAPERAGLLHPDELCNAKTFPDPTAVTTHLFSAFIPAAYAPNAPITPRWTAAQAHRTLVFLAQLQRDQFEGSPDLAWWELPRAVPTFVRWLMGGLTFGLMFGLMFGLTYGLAAGLAPGLAAGLAAGLTLGFVFALPFTLITRAFPGPDFPTPIARFRWSPTKLAIGLAVGLMPALVIGLAVALVPAFRNGFAIPVSILVGLVMGFLYWIGDMELDLNFITAPATLLSSDRRIFITAWLGIALAVGLAVGLTFGVAFGFVLVFSLALGLMFGLTLGLSIGMKKSAWVRFALARPYLVVRRKIPRNLMAFLQDAHENRGVLRQVGAMYQFRHIELQHYLAKQRT